MYCQWICLNKTTNFTKSVYSHPGNFWRLKRLLKIMDLFEPYSLAIHMIPRTHPDKLWRLKWLLNMMVLFERILRIRFFTDHIITPTTIFFFQTLLDCFSKYHGVSQNHMFCQILNFLCFWFGNHENVDWHPTIVAFTLSDLCEMCFCWTNWIAKTYDSVKPARRKP